ncbi:MAG TPA: DUF5615 family PIN-like protein [Xanthobacteraceae bacterium]
MTRFIIDAQLPPALAERLTRQGYPSEHVTRIGLGVAPDEEIWNFITRSGAVLMTKDEDFVTMARAESDGPQVVSIRLGNIANNALWTALERVLDEIIESLNAGETIVEVI